MNKEQQILFGSLLGDGCIYIVNKKYFCYSEGHSLKQKEYLLWKNKTLNYNFYEEEKRQKVNIKKISMNFKCIYNLFYPNGIKIVNKKILDKIELLGLAVWYMDDGYYNYQNKAIDLYTCSFGLKENLLIRKWLKDKFNINSKVKIKKRKYYYINISSKDGKLFIKLVKPYVIYSMNYKLGLNPNKIKMVKEKRRLYELTPKRKEWVSKWIEKNRKRINKSVRRRYWQDINKSREIKAKYRKKNRKRINDCARVDYYKNRERILENKRIRLKKKKIKIK